MYAPLQASGDKQQKDYEKSAPYRLLLKAGCISLLTLGIARPSRIPSCQEPSNSLIDTLVSDILVVRKAW